MLELTGSRQAVVASPATREIGKRDLIDVLGRLVIFGPPSPPIDDYIVMKGVGGEAIAQNCLGRLGVWHSTTIPVSAATRGSDWFSSRQEDAISNRQGGHSGPGRPANDEDYTSWEGGDVIDADVVKRWCRSSTWSRGNLRKRAETT